MVALVQGVLLLILELLLRLLRMLLLPVLILIVRIVMLLAALVLALVFQAADLDVVYKVGHLEVFLANFAHQNLRGVKRLPVAQRSEVAALLLNLLLI